MIQNNLEQQEIFQWVTAGNGKGEIVYSKPLDVITLSLIPYFPKVKQKESIRNFETVYKDFHKQTEIAHDGTYEMSEQLDNIITLIGKVDEKVVKVNDTVIAIKSDVGWIKSIGKWVLGLIAVVSSALIIKWITTLSF